MSMQPTPEQRIASLEAEVTEYDELTRRTSAILTEVANALKGEPPALTMHDWSDLGRVAREHMQKLDSYRRALSACLAKLKQETGWVKFGDHSADDPVPELEFSEELDEMGLPWFERVKQ